MNPGFHAVGITGIVCAPESSGMLTRQYVYFVSRARPKKPQPDLLLNLKIIMSLAKLAVFPTIVVSGRCKNLL